MRTGSDVNGNTGHHARQQTASPVYSRVVDAENIIDYVAAGLFDQTCAAWVRCLTCFRTADQSCLLAHSPPASPEHWLLCFLTCCSKWRPLTRKCIETATNLIKSDVNWMLNIMPDELTSEGGWCCCLLSRQ